MTLPKNNRREITVDNRLYHWTPGRNWDHGNIVIQHSSGVGARIIIDPIGIMRPVAVAEAIRFALANGWSTDDGIADIHLGYVEDNDHLLAGGWIKATVEQFVVRARNAGPYLEELKSGGGSRLGDTSDTQS